MYCIYLQYTSVVRYYLHTLFWYRHTDMTFPPPVNFLDFWETTKPEIQAKNEGVRTYDENWEWNNKYCIVIFPARIPVVWINLRIQLTAEMSKKKRLILLDRPWKKMLLISAFLQNQNPGYQFFLRKFCAISISRTEKVFVF